MTALLLIALKILFAITVTAAFIAALWMLEEWD